MATMTNSTDRRDIDSVTRPDPLTYAPKILCWIIFWPWNLVWSVFVNNPFRYMGQFIVKVIRSTFEEISSGEFKKIEAELSLEPPPIPTNVAPTTNSRSVTPSYIAPSIAAAPTTLVTPSANSRPVSSTTNVEQPNVAPATAVNEQATVVNIVAPSDADVSPSEDKQDTREKQSVTPVELVSRSDRTEPLSSARATNDAKDSDSPNVGSAPSARSDKAWRASKVEDVFPGNRLTGDAAPAPGIETDSINTSNDSGSKKQTSAKADNGDAVTSTATPDPLLYIKHDSTDLPLYKSMQFSKEANPDDPWLAKADPN